jgi:hypothetical protein
MNDSSLPMLAVIRGPEDDQTPSADGPMAARPVSMLAVASSPMRMNRRAISETSCRTFSSNCGLSGRTSAKFLTCLALASAMRRCASGVGQVLSRAMNTTGKISASDAGRPIS